MTQRITREIIEEWRKDPNWINVPFEVVPRPDSGINCVDCGQDVNLYSEGETYDYFYDDERDTTVYMCEDCLGSLQK